MTSSEWPGNWSRLMVLLLLGRLLVCCWEKELEERPGNHVGGDMVELGDEVVEYRQSRMRGTYRSRPDIIGKENQLAL